MMMESQQYKSPLVQFLFNSVLPQIREAAMAHPIGNMLWKSFEPEIPNYLKQLDENRELQNQIVHHLRGLMAMIEEDTSEEPPEELQIPEGEHSRMREAILEDEAKLFAPNHAEGAEEPS